jgi:hypothetical protein
VKQRIAKKFWLGVRMGLANAWSKPRQQTLFFIACQKNKRRLLLIII